jgi:sulfate adenylyltransferase
MTQRIKLVSPYKGKLTDLLVRSEACAEKFSFAASLRSIQLTRRQTCDLEMLATGAFSPLRGFMSEIDYNRVLDEMRLADGTVFPIPITLSTDDLSGIKIGSDIALRDSKNDLLALMKIDEVYEWDRNRLAQTVLGTADPRHPLVAELAEWGRFNLSGEMQVLKLPDYHDFRELRLTPQQTREQLISIGRSNVVAFHTRNPLHAAHEEMTRRAIEMVDGTLLLHPTVGMTKPGDVDHVTRVRTYKAVAKCGYPKEKVLLSIIPLAMRMAGPREALFHGIVRRNYGASHFIIGRDHASPGANSQGKPFYEPFAAQKLFQQYCSEIRVHVLAFPELRYVPKENRWIGAEETKRPVTSISVSGTSIRNDFLANGKEIPNWMMRPQVSQILSDAYPPRHRQGVCVWFTGLSGAGKSTTAEVLTTLFQEAGRQVSFLDGDVVRTHLSKGLGFSREDRDANVTRIGFVASEIVRHGGIVICAAISPYRESRNMVRSMFESGNFIEVFVDTPLDVCEIRDPKGMYALARRGEISNFTGTDDVYEAPEAAEIVLDTIVNSARENAERALSFLRTEGFLAQCVQTASGAARTGG